ncbi:MAG: hypothetical protein KBC00_04380 [Candidatus Levybacteria bacterium]|nr:hypothetical protein [Candidatus Levybacteria bacterium]
MEETTLPTDAHQASQKGITTLIALVIVVLLVIGAVIIFGMTEKSSATTIQNTSSKIATE